MINGFLLVNKHSGITSSQVVQKIKKKFNLKKVGHLGTLDPMATGLLIIAINRATKFAPLLLQPAFLALLILLVSFGTLPLSIVEPS